MWSQNLEDVVLNDRIIYSIQRVQMVIKFRRCWTEKSSQWKNNAPEKEIISSFVFNQVLYMMQTVTNIKPIIGACFYFDISNQQW